MQGEQCKIQQLNKLKRKTLTTALLPNTGHNVTAQNLWILQQTLLQKPQKTRWSLTNHHDINGINTSRADTYENIMRMAYDWHTDCAWQLQLINVTIFMELPGRHCWRQCGRMWNSWHLSTIWCFAAVRHRRQWKLSNTAHNHCINAPPHTEPCH